MLSPEPTNACTKKEIERLWEAKLGTPNDDRLEVLATLVHAYEKKQYPMDPPDPIDAIKFRLESLGLTNQALIAIIGRINRLAAGLRLFRKRARSARLDEPADER
jgi:HTH-type transcriptional regulator / antitoxin HigA